MKLAIKSGIFIVLLTLICIILLNVNTAGIRRNETNRIAQNASYETINTLKKNTDSITSDTDLIAETIKNVLLEQTSNSNTEVKILSIDSRNGLVDLEITQSFKHANGKIEKNTERRTVILEKLLKGSMETEIPTDHTVTFVSNITGEVLAVQKLKNGADAKDITVPSIAGCTHTYSSSLQNITESKTITVIYKDSSGSTSGCK